MKQKQDIVFWLLLVLCFGFFLYLIKGILLPFVVAMIIAYFLDPAADKLEKWGASRLAATLVITIFFFSMLALATVFLAPALYHQAEELIAHIPSYVDYARDNLFPYVQELLTRLDPEALDKAKEAMNTASGRLMEIIGNLVSSLWSSGLALVNLLSLLFITPVVTFYLLRDWDVMVAKIDSWLPRRYKPTVRRQFRLIDQTLSGYLRGQLNVCVLLGLFYAIALMAVGLQFSLFIGMATGILSFLPFIGVMIGAVVGGITALFQFGDITHVIIVLSIFFIGQFIEGNFVAPKLVGDKVGLHPVWIIFGMLAGGAIAGIIGILVAIPVTAVAGVLIRFMLERYLKSSLYRRGGVRRVS